MAGEKLEQFLTTGMIEGKRRRVQQREKVLDRLTKWLNRLTKWLNRLTKWLKID